MIPPSAGNLTASAPSAEADDRRRARRIRVVGWVLLAAFAGLRLEPVFSDLWLDEIWSVMLVRQLHGVREIFTRYLVDNNHPLNSLWIYVIGPTSADWAYRGLSWLAGVASVWLAGEIARLQWRRLHATEAGADAARLIAMVLFGAAYLFVFYSSEARGYSPAVACALLAWRTLLRDEDSPRAHSIYWAACLAGLLAHVVVIQVIAGGIACTAFMPADAKTRLRRLVMWHGVPILFAIVYYLRFVRRLAVGGGPELSVAQVWGEMSAYSFGVPIAGAVSVALPLLVVIMALTLVLIVRRDHRMAAFYGAVFAVALAAPFAGQFDVVYPRYFILVSACALQLCGYGLTRLFVRGQIGRGTVGAVLALFLVGNGVYIRQLWQHGRGEYTGALRYIAQHTAGPIVSATSDQDVRNRTLLAYFWPSAVPDKTLRYLSVEDPTASQAEWMLVHRFDGEAPPAREFSSRQQTYRLAAEFGHAPLSGWDWLVFRNTAVTATPR